MNTIQKIGNIDFTLLNAQLTAALGAPGSPQKWLFNGSAGVVNVTHDETQIAPAAVQAVLDAHDPLAPGDADVRGGLAIDGMDRLQFAVLFNHENRIRVLEAKAAITQAQFRTALIATWKTLNP